MPLDVEAKKLGHALLVRLDGELDLHSAIPFREAVSHAFSKDSALRHLILIMGDVTFVDSSGLGAILGRYREVSKRGGRVAVVGLQLPVKRVFQMAGMLKLVKVFDTEGQALAAL